jgi:CRISPR type III-B/RAMP module-associated protein Cmr5
MIMTEKLSAKSEENELAKEAWDEAYKANKALEGKYQSYRSLVKESASLIATNGLIAALAYFKTRTGPNKEAGKQLAEFIESKIAIESQKNAISKLLELDSRELLLTTNKILNYLKWLRQFVDLFKEDPVAGA